VGYVVWIDTIRNAQKI